MSRQVSDGRIGWRAYSTVGVVVAAVLVAMLIVWGHSHPERVAHHPTADPTSTVPPAPTELTFGVWGTPQEIAAYRAMAAAYVKATPGAKVTVKVFDSPGALAAVLRSSAPAPNVYLIPRGQLGMVMSRHRNRPLQELLADRGLNLGDDYSRNAVTAFSAEDDLQCMPYTVSPMVMYYNTDLIRFARMKAHGLNVPSMTNSSFTLDEFRTAARVAARVGGGDTAGVAIDPTIQDLAPFVLSGGGDVFDDDTDPTRLSLGSDGSTNALRQTLEVLRDPRLTLSSAQLRRHTALEWFERGRVGMIAGYRDLVPQLRAVKGLHFDVLPMPMVGSARTVGDLTGLCLSSGAPHQVQAAADFLTYLSGDAATTRLSRVGSLQPAYMRVAYSPAYQQPNRQPAHAQVFTNLLRYIQVWPLGVPWQRLERVAGPVLRQLMTTPVLDDLDERLDALDQRSQQVLSPPPASSPSGAPSGTPSASPSH